MTVCLIDPLISPQALVWSSWWWFNTYSLIGKITANIHIQIHKNTKSQIFLWGLFLAEQTNFWELSKSWHLTYWKEWNNTQTQMGKLTKKRANHLILDFSAGFVYKSNSASNYLKRKKVPQNCQVDQTPLPISLTTSCRFFK